jgi:NCS1 family nucleobase:cation symporter-1
VPAAATHIYEMSFFTGFGVSSLTYWLLNLAFPVVGKASVFEEIDVSQRSVGAQDSESWNEANESDEKNEKAGGEVYHQTANSP